ncbi:uncharacterized protein LOC128253212 [Drosophila gunungcola]|uniref:uncharacterized protein LOC128253212 n=1 Tax=Drosophila gunungcola TaxID=103775 RepID=UPI0022E94FFD|nr:uncharacterized protein LOC128253212 [Drosophila gunungcola]
MKMGDEEDVPETPVAICALCGKTLTVTTTFRTKCMHEFHKACILAHSKKKTTCPSCNVVCFEKPPPPNTRGQTRSNQESSPAPSASGQIQESNAVQSEVIANAVSRAVRAMQNDLLAQLSAQMAQLIQTNISEHLRPLNENLSQRGGLVGAGNASPFGLGNIDLDAGPGPGSAHGSHRSGVSELSQRPDKVAHIMNGWKIRFSGNEDGLNIDNFIYRVEALTRQTLASDFNTLCGNASILFEGKARDFYWRFHKTAPMPWGWDFLCQALRKQFRDTRSDVDIREAIRDRKQKERENFDSFYEAIMQMMDGLEVPIDEYTVVEILKRNLRPEIRHEILNLSIHSVDRLRDICRRRESFLDEVRKNQGYQKTVPFRKQVAELVEEMQLDEPVEFSDVDDEEEIGALALICWNCHKEGHRYQDCEDKRRIFCYGCGAKNIFKPSCVRCQKNVKKGTQYRQQLGAPKNKSTNTELSQ